MLETPAKTVVVVDFDADVRAQCRSMLEGEGFVVHTGATRTDAREILRDSRADLLIIGLFLADGPGYLVFDEGLPDELAVVGLTDVIQGPSARRLLKERYDFLELLDKPLSGANLIDLMRVHFGPGYPRAPSTQVVDDANRTESELQIPTRIRHQPAASGLAAFDGAPPHFAPVEEPDDSQRHAVDLAVMADVHVPVDMGEIDEDDPGFARVRTSQTYRPAASSLVPEGLDWRVVPDEGSLVHVSVGALLARMLHTRYTGSLRLWRQRVRKIVFFNEGRPVSVRSNLLYECLGNLLVRNGLIDDQTSEASVARAQAEGRRQGEVLVSMGAVTEAQLRDALRQQLEERLLDVFGWSEARYHLHEVPAPPEVAAPSRWQTMALVARGVLERVSLERIIRELEPILPLQMTLQADESRLEALGLDPHHQDVIAELGRGGTLLELVARFEQSSQVYQVAYALLVLGFVALEQ